MGALCLVGTTGLLAGAYHLPLLGWVSLAGLVPLLCWVDSRDGRSAASLGLVFGTLWGICTAPWMPSSLVDLGATTVEAGIVLGISAFLFSGVRFGLWFAAVLSIVPTQPGRRVLVAGLAMFAIDLIADRVPGYVPWALLGHSVVDNGLSQLAVAGGVPVVSGVIAATNVAVASFARRPRCPTSRGVAAAALSGALLTLVGGSLVAGQFEPSRNGTWSALIVQPNVPASERWAPQAQRTHLKHVATKTLEGLEIGGPADLVVWPETMLTVPLEADPKLASDLTTWAGRIATPIILGLTRRALDGVSDRYRNTAVWLDPRGEILDAVDKVRLTPLGERAAFGDTTWPVRHTRIVEPGTEERPLHGTRELAVVFCFEVLFADAVRNRSSADSAAIVNLSNDSWFAGETASREFLRAARFRAIENRAWVLRSAQGGVSAAIDPLGRVVEEIPFGTVGHIRVDVGRPWPAGPARFAPHLLLVAGMIVGLGATRLIGRKS